MMLWLPYLLFVLFVAQSDHMPVSALPDKLLAPDATKFDYFGSCVDLFEDLLVSSSIQDDDIDDRTGSVYSFHLSSNGDEWVFDEKIGLPDPLESSYFGTSLSLGREISGQHQVLLGIGAESYDSVGRAYIFKQHTSTRLWSHQATFRPTDERYLQKFGASGSIYADTYAVGSYADDGGASRSGECHLI